MQQKAPSPKRIICSKDLPARPQHYGKELVFFFTTFHLFMALLSGYPDPLSGSQLTLLKSKRRTDLIASKESLYLFSADTATRPNAVLKPLVI